MSVSEKNFPKRDFSKKSNPESMDENFVLNPGSKNTKVTDERTQFLSKAMTEGAYDQMCNFVKKTTAEQSDKSLPPTYKQRLYESLEKNEAWLKEMQPQIAELGKQRAVDMADLKTQMEFMNPEERKQAQELLNIYEKPFGGSLEDRIRDINAHAHRRNNPQPGINNERIDAFAERLTALVENTGQQRSILTKIADVFRNIYDGIKTGVSKFLDATKTLFRAVGDFIAERAEAILRLHPVINAIYEAPNIIAGAVGGIAHVAGRAANLERGANVIDRGVRGVEGLTRGLNTAINGFAHAANYVVQQR